jgi:hypothetical protein
MSYPIIACIETILATEAPTDTAVLAKAHAPFGQRGACVAVSTTRVKYGRIFALPNFLRSKLIADNRIAEQAGWDRELLAVELGELIELLPAQGLDVTLTGFEVAEIDLLIADMATFAVLSSSVPRLDGPRIVWKFRTSAVAAKSNTRNSRSPPARCSRRSTVNFSRKPWETALTSRRPVLLASGREQYPSSHPAWERQR